MDGEQDTPQGTEVTQLPADDPYLPRAGRPLQYPKDIIERCLYETAVKGGNARKARAALMAWEPDLSWPTDQTIYGWIKGRFAGRYSEICTQDSDRLRERIAQDATNLAIRMHDAEVQALDQTMAGLADANAVEASMILRNLGAAKQMQVDSEGKLRGRANIVVDHRGLDELAQALVNLGIATPVDGEAEEITDAQLAAGD